MTVEFEKVDFTQEPNIKQMWAWQLFGFLEKGFDYGWNVHIFNDDGVETREGNPIYEGEHLNFDWVLEATAENKERLMAEIRKRSAQC